MWFATAGHVNIINVSSLLFSYLCCPCLRNVCTPCGAGSSSRSLCSRNVFCFVSREIRFAWQSITSPFLPAATSSSGSVGPGHSAVRPHPDVRCTERT